MHIHLADRISLVRAIGVFQRGFAAQKFALCKETALRAFDVIQRQHRHIRNGRHIVGTVRTVTAVIFLVQVVINTFRPEERLVHHPVALAAVKFGCASVVVFITAGIIQRTIGHFTVRIVHVNRLARHLHFTARGFLRHLGKHTVALLEDRRHVGIHDVSIAILITGLVVRVGDIGVIRYALVRLDDTVGRLYDLQFRVSLPVSVRLFVLHVLCQAKSSAQAGMTVVYRPA